MSHIRPDWRGVAVLCWDRERQSVLMVQQAAPGELPTWALPGGTIETGETAAAAAVREVREETGLDIRPIREYTIRRGLQARAGRRWYCVYFEADVIGGRLQPQDPDGYVLQATWIPAKQVPALRLSHMDQRRVLNRFLEEKMDRRVEYDAFADIYEVWTETAPIAGPNLHFYVEEYLRSPTPVVELGIGNGRIAIEAALQGKPIVGVDASGEMLRLCRERAQMTGVTDLLTLIQGDFRDFELPEPAQLITIPFHTIGHLLTLEDKEAGLRHIHSQLAPDGRLIFDTFVFRPESAQARNNVATLRAEYVDPLTGQDVLLWVATRYHFKTQTMRIITWTDELNARGEVEQRKYRFLSFSWIEPEQVRALFKETGYQVEAVYGDFERNPFEQGSPEHVWVARRA